ncbi:MAG: tRNA pseudouridine(38-40) synthase TruA [Bryobacteraceae bacterium]|nr:tRNA pseudouridine(38-40) synthase TruA [Bryobacteraceae bacterium]
MRRLKLTIAYDGTDFHGWQVQPRLPTIQQHLEDIFREIEKAPVHVAGSGRTDAGVHAHGQVAAVTLQNPIPPGNLKKAVNRLLPPSIRILQVEEVHEHFHPRFDAMSKTYEYRIWRGEVVTPFDYPFMHHHPYTLNEAAFVSAAGVFAGEHDFSCFAASDESDSLGRSKVRKVFRSEATREGDLLRYRITGSGFLKHMVRNIVGTLLEAGKGNLSEEQLKWLLTAPAGIRATPTAPAKGLFLSEVHYDHRDGTSTKSKVNV